MFKIRVPSMFITYLDIFSIAGNPVRVVLLQLIVEWLVCQYFFVQYERFDKLSRASLMGPIGCLDPYDSIFITDNTD